MVLQQKKHHTLNFFGIDGDYIDYVVDSTPGKQGHFTPGTHLPIYDPSKTFRKYA